MGTEKKRGGSGCLSSIISLAIIASVLIAIWYFFGKIQITTTLDGRPINGALVEIEGVERCQTPCELRLETGSYDIDIFPPAGTRTRESHQTLTVHAVNLVTIGRTYNIPFRSRSTDRTPTQPVQPAKQRRTRRR